MINIVMKGHKIPFGSKSVSPVKYLGTHRFASVILAPVVAGIVLGCIIYFTKKLFRFPIKTPA
jgi:hypothetical protein